MKLDLKLIRKILLQIEEEKLYSLNFEDLLKKIHNEFMDFDSDEIKEHALLLKEADLLEFQIVSDASGYIYITDTFRITWKGFEFLSSIRNDSIFKKIVDKLSPTQNFGIHLVQQIGTKFALELLG
ncbi:hypothetical protein MASR1M45_25470 [Candidatus Kapaibacterium sp.]